MKLFFIPSGWGGSKSTEHSRLTQKHNRYMGYNKTIVEFEVFLNRPATPIYSDIPRLAQRRRAQYLQTCNLSITNISTCEITMENRIILGTVLQEIV